MLKINNYVKKAASGRIGKILLTLIAAVLMFGGPTYFIYVLRNTLPFPYLEILGIALFFVGLYVFLQVYTEEKPTS